MQHVGWVLAGGIILGLGLIVGHESIFARAGASCLDAIHREYPLWFNPRLNPTPPPVRCAEILEDIRAVLQKHGCDPGSADVVFKHLLVTWPGGILGRNAWNALATARDMHLLDTDFLPIASAPFVDEEGRRMQELRVLGGPEAVRVYETIMGR